MKMTKRKLHIQNIFDAVSPNGIDIQGNLLSRCRRLMNRAILQAHHGDFVVLTEDCPSQFIDYVLNLMNIQGVSFFHTKQGINQSNLNAYSIFEGLIKDEQWNSCLSAFPIINPYMKSNEIFKAAKQAGLEVLDKELRSAEAVEHLNDKAIFSKECEKQGIPVPCYYTSTRKDLVNKVIILFEKGLNSLYIRPTKSGGGVGSLTVEYHNHTFSIKNDQNENRTMSTADEFRRVFYKNLENSPWAEFIITEVLDLNASPGTLFHIDSKCVRFLGHTLQLLNSNHQFQGFQYPIEDQGVEKYFDYIEKSIYTLANSWREKGFRGYANIDWMVTKNGQCFLAEFNPRQTSVLSPFNFICAVFNKRNDDGSFILPKISIITNDYVKPRKGMSFEEIIAALNKAKLLQGQRIGFEGIYITIPPLIESQITSFGIMAIAEDLQPAYSIYTSAMHVLKNVDENISLRFNHS